MVHLKFISLGIIVLALPTGQTDECKTPNNETANCVSLYDCPLLLNALTDPNHRNFVLQSNCGGTAIEPKVCCGSRLKSKEVKPTTVKELLPSKSICGFQHSDDFFHTVNGTSITECPWLALIHFKRENKSNSNPNKKMSCFGSLINSKYVLTVAHCLNLSEFTPYRVRLGEYHLQNETDCMLDSGVFECSDSVEDFGIEKVILHPRYKFILNNVYDIGLIRLNRAVIFSDYIRPICLSSPDTKGAKPGDVLYSSGWSWFKSEERAAEKKRIRNTILTAKECQDMYAKRNLPVIVEEGRICGLVSHEDESVCDSGGGIPLMFSHRSQWYLQGIRVHGITQCTGEYPDIYVNVSYFFNWIKENLEP